MTAMSDDRSGSGRCLCGAVRYELRGPLREILICHCVECRRWHGNVGAYTSVERDELVLLQSDSLRWIDSPESDSHARRGFCGECGSSLFWEAAGDASVSIAAGTLDSATELRPVGHIYVSQAGGYYDLPDDGLPRRSRGSELLDADWPTGNDRTPS